MRNVWPWIGALVLAVLVVGVPLLHGRAQYEQFRRFRVVKDGQVYRSGQLYGDGLREIHRRYGLRTVINLQEESEAVNPLVPRNYFRRSKETEGAVCEELGVQFIQLAGGVLDNAGTAGRPMLVDDFFAICDDPKNYPILFHCKAGLHRTGALCAVYRMEYEGWTRDRALEELRASGYGIFKATNDNEYIQRYLFDFAPGHRRSGTVPPKPKAPEAGTP